MKDIFDVFLRKEDGSFEWIGATETFALARQTIVQNPSSSDYVFIIANSDTGEKTVIEPRERPPVEAKVILPLVI